MLFPGSVIAERYRADALLGRGGMGEVWKCFDTSLERSVVIKTVSSDLSRSRPQYNKIFIDEARIGASLFGHPNAVGVFELLERPSATEPLLAIVMEYVEGMSCSEWIERAPSRLSKQTQHYMSLMIAMDAGKALSYAHRSSILHRDIKPLNIFISKYGIAKIGDFGIARYADAVTREHTVWNFRSPAYSAPEQWNDKKPSHPTDIYQLGCTLFHLFTGELPFVAESVAALINMHLTATPKSPSALNPLISQKLSELIVQCLAKDPDSRPSLWEVTDAIAKDLQRQYRLQLRCNKDDAKLISKISAITDFDEENLKANGRFNWRYQDYNEAIGEAFELFFLEGVELELEEVIPPQMPQQPPKAT